MWHTKKFVSRLLLLVFRSQADSGEEINDILNPEFKLGAQSGLDGSNRAAGMPKIKWLSQTCSVELFSRSWDGVNLCDWFLITIHHASAQIIFVKFHLYSLCLVDKKPFFRSIATIFCTTSNFARRDHDFQFKENKFNRLETIFVNFASFRSAGLSVSLATAVWATRSLEKQIFL